MPAIVADTHAAVWYLTNNPKLSARAAEALDAATASGEPIFIASISLVELTYLVEKGRIPAEARKRLAICSHCKTAHTNSQASTGKSPRPCQPRQENQDIAGSDNLVARSGRQDVENREQFSINVRRVPSCWREA